MRTDADMKFGAFLGTLIANLSPPEVGRLKNAKLFTVGALITLLNDAAWHSMHLIALTIRLIGG